MDSSGRLGAGISKRPVISPQQGRFNRGDYCMDQSVGLIALVVRDYDEALAYYVGVLGFRLVEDTYVPEQDKRWVVVTPQGRQTSQILLARAVGEQQSSRIGNQ